MKHHKAEYHNNGETSVRLNKLRAAVLGANDGIVSISGLVIGVASATNNRSTILTAGLAGVFAGALSMSAGEYVSVSSQRDTEQALLEKERYELDNYPEKELEELAAIYEHKGLSPKTALQAAKELTANDAYAAHVDAELGINPDNLANPWHAAVASAGAFFLGAVLPLAAILLPPQDVRIAITFVGTLVALAITGVLSAQFGKAPIQRAVLRVTIGGALAMVVTYTIGRLIGTSI